MNVLDKNINGIGSCMPENHIRSDFNIPHEQSSKAKEGGPSQTWGQSNLGLAKQAALAPKEVVQTNTICCPHLRTYSTLGPLLPVWVVIRGAIFRDLEKITSVKKSKKK